MRIAQLDDREIAGPIARLDTISAIALAARPDGGIGIAKEDVMPQRAGSRTRQPTRQILVERRSTRCSQTAKSSTTVSALPVLGSHP